MQTKKRCSKGGLLICAFCVGGLVGAGEGEVYPFYDRWGGEGGGD